MALSQEDRILISEKLINIPEENAQINNNKDQLEEAKVDAEKKDDVNKNLMDNKTVLINPYQKEIESYDGSGRTVLTEQDIEDSANKTLQNPFFPNDTVTPLPSLPDGIWKQFPPFALNKAIGKDYSEAYLTVDNEEQIITDINSTITSLASLSAGTRSSGKDCIPGSVGVCSNPIYTDQTSCMSGGGTWTPPTSDTYIISVNAQTALTDLVNSLNSWISLLNTTKTNIQTTNSVDSDPSRQAENNIAITEIDNFIPVLSNWLSTYVDFDITTSLPGDCASFNAMVPSNFQPSKLRDNEIQIIQNAISSRQTYLSTRKTEISGHLGDIIQDVSTGKITSSSGFYGDRYKVLDLRLNLMTGTANVSKSLEKGSEAQDELLSSNANAEDVYGGVMAVTTFKAPAAGTNIIHVNDSSLFSVGDSVFIKATDQDELSGNIVDISGTLITLSFIVPKKYRQDIKSRMYKIL